MPTEIDKLYVTLGLDGSDAKKAADEAQASLDKVTASGLKVVKSGKDVDAANRKALDQEKKLSDARSKQTKQFTEGMHSAGLEALKMIGITASVAGAVDFFASIVKGGAELGYMSHNLDMNASELDAWRRVAEETGGTAEGMTAQLLTAQHAVAAAQAGRLDPVLSALGKWGGDPQRAMRSTNDMMMEQSRIIQRISRDHAELLPLVTEELGVSRDNLELMRRGPEAMREQLAAQEKITAASKQFTEEAQQADKNWKSILNTVQDLGREWFVKLMTHPLETLAMINPIGGYLGALGKMEKRFKKEESAPQPAPVGAPQPAPVGAPPSTPAAAPKQSGGSVADRNNNPGNIEAGSFAMKHGAIGANGRFAVFPSVEAGIAAQRALMEIKGRQGMNLSQAISSWAPPNENNTGAYQKMMLSAVGGKDMRFQDYSPEDQQKLLAAQARHEGFHAAAVSPRSAMPATAGGANTTNTSSSQTTIGSVTIQTPATADQIPAMKAQLERYGLIAQANTGMLG
jgi:hypothetical protein